MSIILNPYAFSSSAYTTDAVVFDGTNDYMSRGANLTGVANGNKGTASFWIKFNGGDGIQQYIYGANFIIIKSALNIIQFVYGSTILNLKTSSSITTSSGWVHVLSSWDNSIDAYHLYINNSSDSNSPSGTGASIIYSATNHFIGISSGLGNKLNASLADFYFNMSEYIDLSNSSNRAKFINQSTLKPVNLGATGSIPTGTAPIIFQRCDDGAAASTFATNLGTGGNFSITGSLTTSPTSPSD